MRYVVVSVVKGEAGNFNNNLRKEVYEKFNAKSSKLPAHFTIKSPFETDNIVQLENTLDKFSKENYSAPYKIKGYDHFDDRVIFVKVIMSKEGKILHDNLIDSMSSIDYINFDKLDGKNKIFHIFFSYFAQFLLTQQKCVVKFLQFHYAYVTVLYTVYTKLSVIKL